MPGLTDEMLPGSGKEAIARSHQAWEESMLRQAAALRQEIRQQALPELAARAGGLASWQAAPNRLDLPYWGRTITITWPALEMYEADGSPLSLYDSAMLLYYLKTAGSAPSAVVLAGRWASFRELPGGGFYHQAFQGYSGDVLARHFHEREAAFHTACQALGGRALPEINPTAYAFTPLESQAKSNMECRERFSLAERI